MNDEFWTSLIMAIGITALLLLVFGCGESNGAIAECRADCYACDKPNVDACYDACDACWDTGAVVTCEEAGATAACVER
jgi:hypothetical protein